METDFIGQQLSLFEKDDYILETVSQKAIFEENYALNPEWTNNDFTPVKHTFSHQKWTIEMVEGSVNDDKLTTDKELCWVAAEDFDQFPMATPQKKMIKTYEDSKKDSIECYPFCYTSRLACFRPRKARYTFERTTPKKI